MPLLPRPSPPGLLDRAAARVWAWRAARRRAGGAYSRATLAAFQAAAWRGGAAELCRLASFRRDLGRPLPGRWVAPLRAGLPALSPALRRRALGLLAERGATALAGLPAAWLADAAARLPGVAAALGGADPMADSRQAFAAWLARRRAEGGVCVVGNAAGLAGRGLGAAIDAHAAVLRFNRWQGPGATAHDSGRRCDVWVLAPDLDAVEPPAGLAWAVLSGPDPRYALQQWALTERLRAAGVRVLTVPLPVWRGLVGELQAPPSAGLLSLAWLRQLGGGWAGLSVAGIGCGAGAAGRYHLADLRAAAGRRHAWRDEAALVARWRAAGLHDLGEADGGPPR